MSVKVLELCNVAPPNGSVQPCTLPLTVFDLVWYMLPVSVERVFFYHVPHCSTSTFLSTHLPDLKRSLSLALRLFYPLAGRLVLDAARDHPCIAYSDGDSVVLTVAESHDDLQELTSDAPKDAARLGCLVSRLPLSEANQPVAALQVTLFPEQGIAVGITALHLAMDAFSTGHFMRTWASMCKLPGGEEEKPPFYDRSRLWEPIGLQSPLFTKITKIKQMRSFFYSSSNVGAPTDVVHATFHLSRAKVEELRKWVDAGRASHGAGGARFSSFTLAAALVWTCILKARGSTSMGLKGLSIPINCRASVDPPLPASYFGNVVSGCPLEVEGNALLGEEGLVAAALAIQEAVRGFTVADLGAKRQLVELLVDHGSRMSTKDPPLGIASSPRVRVYEVDFGWGRPMKVELVSIARSGSMSLSETRRGDAVQDGGGGGLEIGLAQPLPVMEEFTKLFNATLNKACSS